MDVTTVKCPICNDPYKFYAFSAADQSACPDCVGKAERKENKRLYVQDLETFKKKLAP